MDREYTPIPNEWYEEMEELTDEEFGRLIRFCIFYCETGQELPAVDNERFYYRRAINTMKRFNEGWETVAEKRKAAAQKAAAARWGKDDAERIQSDANAYERIETYTDAMRSNAIYANQNQNQSLNQKDNTSVFLSTRARAQERNGDLPKWASVDDVLKEEVCENAADIYRQYVPGKELKPGICISLYTMICSVDNGKVYVDSGKVEAVRGAYERALNMGKPGNPNVIRFVLQEVSA